MQYPRVLTMKDGRNETPLTVQDLYLIDRYMGYDALRYFRSIYKEAETECGELIEELQFQISDLEDRLETLRRKTHDQ